MKRLFIFKIFFLISLSNVIFAQNILNPNQDPTFSYWNKIELYPELPKIAVSCTESSRHFLGCVRAINRLLQYTDKKLVFIPKKLVNKENKYLIQEIYADFYLIKNHAQISYMSVNSQEFNQAVSEIDIRIYKKFSWGDLFKNIYAEIPKTYKSYALAKMINTFLQTVYDSYTYIQPRDFLKSYEPLSASYHHNPTDENIKGYKIEIGAKKIIYMKINSFDVFSLGNNFKKIFQELGGYNQLEGFILDLRDNQGGDVAQAAQILDFFIPHAGWPLGYIERFNQSEYYEITSTQDSLPLPLHTLVLINSQTKSAAEFLAGGLQNYGFAVVLGETSFGKGTFQEYYEIDGVTLYHPESDKNVLFKKTSGQLILPSAKSYHHRGIVPDIEIITSTDKAERERSLLYTYPRLSQFDDIAIDPIRPVIQHDINQIRECFKISKQYYQEYYQDKDIILLQAQKAFRCGWDTHILK
ncbi:MAG: hypothetical protein KBD63_00790 [Bacteriovoracaceae bacterium]|nr:hypothetical protein [Bacteriovoracaceae bacterium]